MTKPDKNLLRRLIGLPAAPQPGAEFDPADMGTAFGLDYSLDQPPLAPQPTLRSTKRAAGTTPSAVAKGWLKRRGN